MEFLSTISPSKYDLFIFFKVIPSTGSKLKRPTPAFHSSRTSLAGDTSNSSSPASTGAKTNRAGKDLPQLFPTAGRGEGMARPSGNSRLPAVLHSSLRSRDGEKHRCGAQRTAGSNLASREQALPQPKPQHLFAIRNDCTGETVRGKGPPRAGPS